MFKGFLVALFFWMSLAVGVHFGMPKYFEVPFGSYLENSEIINKEDKTIPQPLSLCSFKLSKYSSFCPMEFIEEKKLNGKFKSKKQQQQQLLFRLSSM